MLLDAAGVVRGRRAVDARVVGGQGRRDLGRLLHQLEDGQPDGYDEREERQLQGVPGLQAQHADGQRDQGQGLQHDEHHDRHEDLLELVAFACGTRADFEKRCNKAGELFFCFFVKFSNLKDRTFCRCS